MTRDDQLDLEHAGRHRTLFRLQFAPVHVASR